MAVRGVVALQEELDKAKESLKGVDETIKKLTGRDPGDGRGPLRRGREEVRGRGRIFGAARRSITEEASPVASRRLSGGSAFGRLGPRVAASRLRPERRPDSGDEEELRRKPTVQSSVVASPRDSQSRQDKIEEEGKDGAGRQRNRRMFGLLLGTLRQFKDEEKMKGDKEKQRKAIENKLEEKAKEEKEELKKERLLLFNERRAKQTKLRRLEQKMELVDIHEEWEKQTQKLMHFIRTKAKPPIYYLPRSHTSATERKKSETSKVLEEIIIERRKQLEEEIEELTREQDAKDEGEDLHEMNVSREDRREDVDEEEEQGDSPTKRDRHNISIDEADHRVVQMEADGEDKENGDIQEEAGQGEERERERKSSRRGSRKSEDAEKGTKDEEMGGEEVREPRDQDMKELKEDRERKPVEEDRKDEDRMERESRKERTTRHRKDSSRSTDDQREGERSRKRRVSSTEREGGDRKRSYLGSKEKEQEHEHKKQRREPQRSRTSSASDGEPEKQVEVPKEIPKDDGAMQEKEVTTSEMVDKPADVQAMQQSPPKVALEDIEMPKDVRNVVSTTQEN